MFRIFQLKVTHKIVETTPLKNTINLNSIENSLSVSNKFNESESTYIEELVSKNSVLKNLILKVNYQFFNNYLYSRKYSCLYLYNINYIFSNVPQK